jgi:hypothetical protein
MTASRIGSGLDDVKRGDAGTAAWSVTHAVVLFSGTDGKFGMSTTLGSVLAGLADSFSCRPWLLCEVSISGVDGVEERRWGCRWPDDARFADTGCV